MCDSESLLKLANKTVERIQIEIVCFIYFTKFTSMVQMYCPNLVLYVGKMDIMTG